MIAGYNKVVPDTVFLHAGRFKPKFFEELVQGMDMGTRSGSIGTYARVLRRANLMV